MISIETEKKYKRIKQLGNGPNGPSYLCQCQQKEILCVIKEIEMNNSNEAEKKLNEEFSLLSKLNHVNIIGYIDSYVVQEKLCIVMNYAEGGDVKQYIVQQQNKNEYIQESQIQDWFMQMCLAVKFCHDSNIIHRDIKSSNFFLTRDLQIQLADFGIAKLLNNKMQMAESMVGTPYYISPEIIQNQQYSFKVDIWGLGVVLYELCALKLPFEGETLEKLTLNIIRCKYDEIPNHYSQLMKSLVKRLLTIEQKSRPSIDDLLKMLPDPNNKLAMRKEYDNIFQRQKNKLEDLTIPLVIDEGLEEGQQKLKIKQQVSSQKLLRHGKKLEQNRLPDINMNTPKKLQINRSNSGKQKQQQSPLNIKEPEGFCTQRKKPKIVIQEIQGSFDSEGRLQDYTFISEGKILNINKEEVETKPNKDEKQEEIIQQQEIISGSKEECEDQFFEECFKNASAKYQQKYKDLQNNQIINELQILCSNINCRQDKITFLCLSPSCQKFRLICKSCWKDHKDHANQVELIQQTLQFLPHLEKTKKIIQEKYEKLMEKKIKEFTIALEASIKIKDSPIFLALDSKQHYEYWNATDWNDYGLNLAQIDIINEELTDSLAIDKLEKLKSFDISKLIQNQRFEIKTQNLHDVQPSPLMNNQTKSHIQLLFEIKNANESILVAKNKKAINFPLEMKNIIIVPQNLINVEEQKVQLFLELEGELGNGNNSFGLYCGSLSKCTYKEKKHISNLFVMSDSGNYSLFGEIGQKEEFKMQKGRTSIGLILDKRKGQLKFSNLETQKIITFILKKSFQELYFCVILSAGGIRVKII